MIRLAPERCRLSFGIEPWTIAGGAIAGVGRSGVGKREWAAALRRSVRGICLL